MKGFPEAGPDLNWRSDQDNGLVEFSVGGSLGVPSMDGCHYDFSTSKSQAFQQVSQDPTLSGAVDTFTSAVKQQSKSVLRGKGRCINHGVTGRNLSAIIKRHCSRRRSGQLAAAWCAKGSAVAKHFLLGRMCRRVASWMVRANTISCAWCIAGAWRDIQISSTAPREPSIVHNCILCAHALPASTRRESSTSTTRKGKDRYKCSTTGRSKDRPPGYVISLPTLAQIAVCSFGPKLGMRCLLHLRKATLKGPRS